MSVGPYLHSLEVSRLSKCSSEIQRDGQTFGIDCVRNQLEFQQIVVMYPTAIQQLKTEAALRNPQRQTFGYADHLQCHPLNHGEWVVRR